MLASHWVIEDIVKAIESKDSGEIESSIKNFTKKYPEDKEVVRLCKEYMKNKDSKLLAAIKVRLKALSEERKMESTGGGGNLWFGDRRGHGDQTLR
ncbi:MAG: hypothetical protein KAS04_05815 [Candidatus Aenigmarchaeota archaeon]|nr:hypothetical protein [Candidatus Aenigmarchaeota archaeon]